MDISGLGSESEVKHNLHSPNFDWALSLFNKLITLVLAQEPLGPLGPLALCSVCSFVNPSKCCIKLYRRRSPLWLADPVMTLIHEAGQCGSRDTGQPFNTDAWYASVANLTAWCKGAISFLKLIQSVKPSQFYLYSPKSEITICLRGRLSLDPRFG